MLTNYIRLHSERSISLGHRVIFYEVLSPRHLMKVAYAYDAYYSKRWTTPICGLGYISYRAVLAKFDTSLIFDTFILGWWQFADTEKTLLKNLTRNLWLFLLALSGFNWPNIWSTATKCVWNAWEVSSCHRSKMYDWNRRKYGNHTKLLQNCSIAHYDVKSPYSKNGYGRAVSRNEHHNMRSKVAWSTLGEIALWSVPAVIESSISSQSN